MASTAHELIELPGDRDWYAVDGTGAVACFSSGGGGLAPVTADVKDIEARYTLHKSLASLPLVGEGIPNPMLIQKLKLGDAAQLLAYVRGGGWLEMSERGFFSYDVAECMIHGSPYELVCSPSAPVNVDSLPPHVRAIIERTRLPTIRFAELDRFDPRALRP